MIDPVTHQPTAEPQSASPTTPIRDTRAGRSIFIVPTMIGVVLLGTGGSEMSGEWHRKHLGDDVPEQAPGEETLLGAAGDGVPPGGLVAGSFSQEFPGADPYAGIPADEVGLPPLSEGEQEAVAREADRLAEDLDSRRNL